MSRWRHVFGKSAQPTDQYRNVAFGSVYLDSNPLDVNETWIAYPTRSDGNNCIALVKRVGSGSIPEDTPTLASAEPTNGFSLSPFHQDLVATAHQDGLALLWKIPEDATGEIDTPLAELEGHEKRLLQVLWHPTAENILVSFCGGKVVKLWDVSTQAEITTLPQVHKSLIQSVTWNGDGSLCLTTAKDKKMRLFDPRATEMSAEVAGHEGARGGRARWLPSLDRVVSVGFRKNNSRELSYFDPRDLTKPLQNFVIDQASSSSLFTDYDDEISLLYVWGKGDGNIRYYETLESTVELCSEFKSKEPTSGLKLLPKQVVDTTKGELDVFQKITPKIIDTVKFYVPRGESAYFDEDVWVPTWDRKPLYSAAEWAGGATGGTRQRVSLDPGAQ